jgi:purine-binding chemotaxis protein CheW
MTTTQVTLNTPEANGPLTGQFATFFVGDLCFGIEVMRVQEVLRYQEITSVPQAPGVIEGLINLRGQIVTAIDMRRRLGLPVRDENVAPMNMVLRCEDGALSLLVDEIGDVIEVGEAAWEEPPPTLTGDQAKVVRGVYKLDDRLMLVLRTDAVVDVSGNENTGNRNSN